MRIADLTPADVDSAAELWREARAGNDAALGFYEHLGFEHSDVQVRGKWLV